MSPNTVLGIVYIVIILISLPLHLSICSIIVRRQEYRNLTAYMIMTHLSISECLLMIGHFMGGVMSIAQSTFHLYFDRIAGCFISSSWISIVLLSLLLAVNRFFVISDIMPSVKSEKRYLVGSLVVIWLTTITVFVVHLFPEFALWYDVQLGAYRYTPGKATDIIENIEHHLLFSSLVLQFLFYVATVFVVVTKLFVSKKEYGERMSFKIMTSLGVVDCLHLLAHFMTGLMTILHTRIHVVVERVTGTLILSSWVGMAGMIFALALNRIAVLTSVKLTKSREKSLFYALATIIWLSYIAVTGLHLTNDGAVSYRIRESSFSYVLTDLNYYLEKYESYWILFLLIMAFICYVGIVVWIVLHKNFRPTHLKIERREVKILIQAIIIFVYMATLRSIWHLGPQWYLKNVAVVDTLNILTCLVGGVNPLLYLTFNRKRTDEVREVKK
ncbi:hypothetical protein QR680_010152 [Steinernema hermaphroditum]|uniref:Uncharacterized protein n=1 Tax=Steinernema hermaphroditum TaxID=289476 RepID=A0AA39IPA6_9BILA|nr:hypothetical protein QR680_010152 [Steinernema hermaphroditum]